MSSIPLALLRVVRGNFMCTRINGYVLKVDLRDTVVGFQILFQHQYDPTLTALFSRVSRPGDHVVDVGGHIGYYSILFGTSVAPLGRVVAIEPHVENADLIRENASLNGLDAIVTVVNAAAGARVGNTTLYRVDVGNRGDSRLFDDGDQHRGQRRQAVTVPMTTVDECTKNWPRVDLVKMDVQGYELHVLDGMERVLNENPALVLMVEFWPWGLKRAGTDPNQLLLMLIERGFTLVEVPDEGPVRPVDTSELLQRLEATSDYTNILCARAGSEKRLGSAGIPLSR